MTFHNMLNKVVSSCRKQSGAVSGQPHYCHNLLMQLQVQISLTRGSTKLSAWFQMQWIREM